MIPTAGQQPTPTLAHSWPEKLLVGLLSMGAAAFIGLVSTILSLRESVARLDSTVTALQRQVDRLDGGARIAHRQEVNQ